MALRCNSNSEASQYATHLLRRQTRTACLFLKQVKKSHRIIGKSNQESFGPKKNICVQGISLISDWLLNQPYTYIIHVYLIFIELNIKILIQREREREKMVAHILIGTRGWRCPHWGHRETEDSSAVSFVLMDR